MKHDNIFRQKIDIALGNLELQKALDGNADRRQEAFTRAYSTLPEPLEVMRQRAHAIRADVIDNLDTYLEQFISQARTNGFVVHRAETPEQAVALVLQIAQQAQARVIAKSKSMVSEEIQLNKALEADGIQVIETDLGEYIVQLRKEPPAHIITPAVHINRSQVAKTFQDKLDIPYSEDIQTLTAAARRVLRQTFLEAEVGISGVNFGVAQTGSLCIITNEGNGRMVTTLPETHIALMGIERLVSTMDDLAIMLYLLPRSATGQKLTVYTNLIHGPRGEGEIDGARQRHLILLDHGRLALRSSALKEALYCIRCGACLNACPVFREIGGHAYVGAHGQHTPYPGPIGSVVSPAMFGLSEFGHLARASSLCGACKEACPVDIDLPKLLLRMRATPDLSHHGDNQPTPDKTPIPGNLRLSLRIFKWLATSPKRFHTAQRLLGLSSRLFTPRSEWLRLPKVTGWGYQRDFPRPALRPFRDRYADEIVNNRIGPDTQTIQSTSKPAATEQSKHLSNADRLTQFETELTTLGGQFSTCSKEELPQRLLALLQENNILRIQSWSTEHLPNGLLQKLSEAGIQIEQEPNPKIQAGITGAISAIAETGTLIVPSGPGRPLTASLLPEIHIVVLYASSLVESMSQAFKNPEMLSATSTVLISGPSRTADIEMTLTIGVHGPRQVHVYCLED